MGVSRYARDKFQKDLTNNSSARANIMVKYDLILTQIHEKNSHSRSGDQFFFFPENIPGVLKHILTRR